MRRTNTEQGNLIFFKADRDRKRIKLLRISWVGGWCQDNSDTNERNSGEFLIITGGTYKDPVTDSLTEK